MYFERDFLAWVFHKTLLNDECSYSAHIDYFLHYHKYHIIFPSMKLWHFWSTTLPLSYTAGHLIQKIQFNMSLKLCEREAYAKWDLNGSCGKFMGKVKRLPRETIGKKLEFTSEIFNILCSVIKTEQEAPSLVSKRKKFKMEHYIKACLRLSSIISITIFKLSPFCQCLCSFFLHLFAAVSWLWLSTSNKIFTEWFYIHSLYYKSLPPHQLISALDSQTLWSTLSLLTVLSHVALRKLRIKDVDWLEKTILDFLLNLNETFFKEISSRCIFFWKVFT